MRYGPPQDHTPAIGPIDRAALLLVSCDPLCDCPTLPGAKGQLVLILGLIIGGSNILLISFFLSLFLPQALFLIPLSILRLRRRHRLRRKKAHALHKGRHRLDDFWSLVWDLLGLVELPVTMVQIVVPLHRSEVQETPFRHDSKNPVHSTQRTEKKSGTVNNGLHCAAEGQSFPLDDVLLHTQNNFSKPQARMADADNLQNIPPTEDDLLASDAAEVLLSGTVSDGKSSQQGGGNGQEKKRQQREEEEGGEGVGTFSRARDACAVSACVHHLFARFAVITSPCPG